VRPFDAAALGSLAQEAARLGRLVEDLHLLSQSDLGSLSYRKEPVDVGDLVADTVEAHGRALQEKAIRVDLDLEPDVRLDADANRLSQLLGNLMQNTLRYTDSPGSLRIRLRRKGGGTLLEWADSSPGVAPQHLPRLTDRLYRVDSARSGEGAGLGLAIAKAIVEAHGGTMTAGPSSAGGLEWSILFRHG